MTQSSSRNSGEGGRSSVTATSITTTGRSPAPRTLTRRTTLVLIVVVVFVYLLIQRGYPLPEAANGVLVVGLAAAEIARRLAFTR